MSDKIKVLFGDQEVGLEGFVDLILQIQDHLKKPKKADEPGILGGWVYVIKSGDYYKIGSCVDYKRRLKHYKSLPESADVIFLSRTHNHRRAEAELHNMFVGKLTNSEWFDLSQKDVNRIGDYLADKEIERIEKLGSLAEVVTLNEMGVATNRIKSLKQYAYASQEVVEKQVEKKRDLTTEREEKDKQLFEQAVEYCTIKGTASASDIQSHFGIGYPKAKKIVNEFERLGFVDKNEPHSSSPRKFTPPETL
jgi:DNA segregation ATPase FtsK/SpoIIIE-like protein